MKQSDADDDSKLSFKTYIDSKGTIRGFSLNNDETKIFCAIGKKKDDVAVEFSIADSGTKIISLTLNARETGKEKYSGSVTMNIDK